MHFEQDIKPLFPERDRNAMRFAFDLWSHDDVSTHADAILGRLEAGTMPCDRAWPADASPSSAGGSTPASAHDLSPALHSTIKLAALCRRHRHRSRASLTGSSVNDARDRWR